MSDRQGEFRLYTINPADVPKVWDEVREFLDSALVDHGHLTLEDIYQGLIHEVYQLWTPFSDKTEAAIVTAIYEIRGDKNCTFVACGGKHLGDWKHLIPVIEAWAKSEGCTHLRIYGRRGWAKTLGYDIIMTEMRKTL